MSSRRSQRSDKLRSWISATALAVERRIALGEGQKTEFKESFSLERKIIETLAAFANSRGGDVFVGVRNDKKVVGVTVGANTLERFANNAKTASTPPLSPEIAEVLVGGRTVVVISMEAVSRGEVVYCYNTPLVRVGRTNQLMSSALQKKRLFADFTRENRPIRGSPKNHRVGSESWDRRELRRVQNYIQNRGLFLVHTWQPSEEAGQIADIVIRLQQHPGPDQPLSDGKVKAVEYYLGSRFFQNTIVKTTADDGFKLEVSAYGPVLCLAVVHFDDDHSPIELYRYVDFQ